MANAVTYKDLHKLVQEQIDKSISFQNTTTFRNQLDRQQISTLAGNSSSDISAAQLISSVQTLLKQALPDFIIEGLQVQATSPESSNVIITAGRGSRGGAVYTLLEDTVFPIPVLTIEDEVLYICLYKDRIILTQEVKQEYLKIAKLNIPVPGTTFKFYNNKNDRPDTWQGYIQSYQEFKLYSDPYDNLEEDSIEKFRNNIGQLLADNLIGNLRLSENLKITNTQGSLEMDSSGIKLFDSNEDLQAKFDRRGTFFYDSNNSEVARFTRDDARIGNITITRNSIGSSDFISENRGFRIQDDGYAEFENVRIRGRISSSVFEYDKVSSVGGKLYVGNSSVLATDMTALDSSTLKTDDSVFAVGDILLIKDGTNEEYIQVTSIASAPTYAVTRDLANTFTADNNPAWAKGTAVVSTGNGLSGSLTGFIKLDAVSNYAPFIDITQRNSTTYNDVTTRARLGNLSGITDSLYGTLTGYGLYSDNVFLKGKLYAPDIKTAVSGSRLELNTCCMAGYDNSGNRTFMFDVSTHPGDFCLGDFSGSKGVMWDASACTFCIRGSFNACDICTGCMSADFIRGGNIYLCSGMTIGTIPDASGIGPQRTTFDANGISSYNTSGVKKFQLCDGQICAQDIRLQDPTCACCYSYLNAGALTFHDELGDVPYVKRIADGTACTGTWVCLLGWRVAPKIIVSIKSLDSYNATNSAQTQRWNVYSDTPVQYCNSGMNYGYCFQVHACLEIAAGTGGECIKSSAFLTCFCTAVGVCSTKVRTFFQLWCNAVAPGHFYYGTLCYAICYRCLGCAVWCASCSCYTQAHSTQIEMQTNGEQTQTISFPCNAQWEIMLAESALTWTDSGIASGSIVCSLCCRAASVGCLVTSNYSCTGCLVPDIFGVICCQISSFGSVALAGTNPSNVFCNYFCYCFNTPTPSLCQCVHMCSCCSPNLCAEICYTLDLNNGPAVESFTNNCTVTGFHPLMNFSFSCVCTPVVCCIKTYTSTYNSCNFTCVRLCTCIYQCFGAVSCNHCAAFCQYCSCACVGLCFIQGTLFQCYCSYSGAAACCVFHCAHSLCDNFGTSCVLDPTGYLNWMAIAYT